MKLEARGFWTLIDECTNDLVNIHRVVWSTATSPAFLQMMIMTLLYEIICTC